MAESADPVSCNMCRWSEKARNEYAFGGCMATGLQQRFWQTGSQVNCGLFTGITMARRKQVDDNRRGVQTESLF